MKAHLRFIDNNKMKVSFYFMKAASVSPRLRLAKNYIVELLMARGELGLEKEGFCFK
jgi:hypothetical protein